MITHRTKLAAPLACAWLLLIGCGPAPSPQGASDPGSSRTSGAGAGISQRQRQIDFLNRIRQADPQYQTIQKAVLNESNQLGLVLSRDAELDAIPRLMRAALTEMAAEFPGQDLTVIAYAPANPPIRIGTGHLNAQTRAMTYTPEPANNR